MDCNNNSNSKETKRDRLIVDDVSEITLEKILNFIYNGTIEFENDCVKILMAADCYQVQTTDSSRFVYHCRSIKTLSLPDIESQNCLRKVSDGPAVAESGVCLPPCCRNCKLPETEGFRTQILQTVQRIHL